MRQHMLDAEIILPQWVSSRPAVPITKLLVQPRDFPFLVQIHGHDDEKLRRPAADNPNGFPWSETLDT